MHDYVRSSTPPSLFVKKFGAPNRSCSEGRKGTGQSSRRHGRSESVLIHSRFLVGEAKSPSREGGTNCEKATIASKFQLERVNADGETFSQIPLGGGSCFINISYILLYYFYAPRIIIQARHIMTLYLTPFMTSTTFYTPRQDLRSSVTFLDSIVIRSISTNSVIEQFSS